MGILNVTPDSFYDQGQFFDVDKAIAHGKLLYSQGADIIDIGGESTRPAAQAVSAEIELKRVLPILEALHAELPVQLSIDTMKAKVAASAIEKGATLINDVSGFVDPEMRALAASSRADICVMHMQGRPENMQQNPYYEEGIVPFLLKWFEERLELLIQSGVKESQIILDPGIGFGKTVADNLEIIQNLHRFKAIGFPLLLGVSRKSFMGKIVNKPSNALLLETIAINTVAAQCGVDILRVHDVREHRDVLMLLEKLTET